MADDSAPKEPRKRKFEPIRLIGLVVLVVLLANVDLARLWALLTGLTARQIALAGAAVLGLLIARCERWHRLLSAAGIALTRGETYQSCLRSMWLGYLTPGRVGEFKRGFDLAKRQFATPSAATALVMLDLGADAVVAIAVVGVALLTAYVMATPIIALVGGFWVCLALMIATVLATRPALSGLALLSSQTRFLVNVTEILKRLVASPRFVLLNLLLLTVLIEGFYVAMMIPLFKPIDGTLTISNATVIVMTGTVTALIPITYFGLGTREAALLLLLAGAGRSFETTIALSLTFVGAQAIGLVVTVALDLLVRGKDYFCRAPYRSR